MIINYFKQIQWSTFSSPTLKLIFLSFSFLAIVFAHIAEFAIRLSLETLVGLSNIYLAFKGQRITFGYTQVNGLWFTNYNLRFNVRAWDPALATQPKKHLFTRRHLTLTQPPLRY